MEGPVNQMEFQIAITEVKEMIQHVEETFGELLKAQHEKTDQAIANAQGGLQIIFDEAKATFGAQEKRINDLVIGFNEISRA